MSEEFTAVRDALAGAFAAVGRCERALKIFHEAIRAARLVSAPAVVQSVAAVVPCLAGAGKLEVICSALVEVRRWWPERPRSGSERPSGSGATSGLMLNCGS